MKLLCLIAIVAAPLGGCASSALHEVAQRAMDGCQAVRHHFSPFSGRTAC